MWTYVGKLKFQGAFTSKVATECDGRLLVENGQLRHVLLSFDSVRNSNTLEFLANCTEDTWSDVSNMKVEMFATSKFET